MRSVHLILLVLSPSCLLALGVSNPAGAELFCEGSMPCCLRPALLDKDWLSCRVGFYGNYVTDRRMKGSTEPHGSVRQTSLTTNAGLVTLNLCNRLDLFAHLGASNILITGTHKSLTTISLSNESTISSETYFSYGVGAQGVIFKCGPFSVGGEAQYFYTNPGVTSEVVDNNSSILIPSNVRMKYQEWQLAGGISYYAPVSEDVAIVPYIGLQLAHSWIDMGHGIAIAPFVFRNLEEQQLVGYAIGVTLVGAHRVGLNLEQRFANENAFSLMVGFQY